MRLAAAFGESWVTVDGRGAKPELMARFEDACVAINRDPATAGKLALLGFEERPLEHVSAPTRFDTGRHIHELPYLDKRETPDSLGADLVSDGPEDGHLTELVIEGDAASRLLGGSYHAIGLP